MGAARWQRSLLSLAALAILAAACMQAGRIGWADYGSLEARFLVDQAGRDGRPLPILQWLRAHDQLQESLRWNAANPVFDEYLASLYFMRGAAAPANSAEMNAFYDRALQHYLRAAALRPTSGYAHASVATVKFRLGQFDADFSRALVLASRYGPWEPAVQEQVIDAGLRTWPALSPEVREEVRGNLRRAYQVNEQRTREFLSVRKAVLPACAQLGMALPGICP
jgi:tetratricopeptide (TPR) repeat protein